MRGQRTGQGLVREIAHTVLGARRFDDAGQRPDLPDAEDAEEQRRDGEADAAALPGTDPAAIDREHEQERNGEETMPLQPPAQRQRADGAAELRIPAASAAVAGGSLAAVSSVGVQPDRKK